MIRIKVNIVSGIVNSSIDSSSNRLFWTQFSETESQDQQKDHQNPNKPQNQVHEPEKVDRSGALVVVLVFPINNNQPDPHGDMEKEEKYIQVFYESLKTFIFECNYHRQKQKSEPEHRPV